MNEKLLSQILLMSRFTLYSICIQCMLCSMLLAKNSNAQKVSIRDIYLSIDLQNTSLDEALSKISEETSFSFAYNEGIVNKRKKINVKVENQSLEELLLIISRDANLAFKRINENIYVNTLRRTKIPVSEILPVAIVRVTGRVTDENGEGLPSVNILVKGTATGTISDIDGNYQIEVEKGNTLIFSSIGYVTREVVVGEETVINVSLSPDVSTLSEVVVVGYGEQKKVTITGSVAAVKGEELVKSPAINLTNSLAGRVPGLIVTQSSAEPGFDNAAIRIRGTNTFNNTGALVVIDGVPNRSGGISRINPLDIESISVLKDASAAIYGARAANGVILITTKRGKRGKPEFTYSFNQGWAQPTSVPDVANAAEYAELRNELEVYNLPVDEWQAATDAFNATGTFTRPNGSVRNAPFSPEDIELFKNGNDPWGHPDTDWFDETFKTWSPQTRHNLQMTGGSDNFTYLTSIGYQNQDAYYKNSATGYKQYDIRINLDGQINDYIKTSIGLVGREEFRFFPTQSAGAIFRMLTRGRPTEPAFWPNGLPGPDIENGQNPVVITTNQTGYDRSRRDYFQTNGTLDIAVPWIDGLKLQGTAAIDKFIERRKVWQTPWFLYTWDGSSFETDGVTPALVKGKRGPAEPRLTQADENQLNILLGATATYERSFGDHELVFLAGVNRETVEFDGFNAFRRFFISTAIDQLFAGGDEQQDNSGIAFEEARLNYFGRVGYNFQQKYLFEFLWRYDGSFLFPEDTRFGFFPGVSAGWVISEENFFKNAVSFFDFLKIRGSWGQLGNDDVKPGGVKIPPLNYLSTYGFGTWVINSAEVTTLRETRVPNPAITWEVANNSNLGIEAEFLDQKFNFEFDVFYNKRTDILTTPSASLPDITGITPPRQNIGEVENKGFDFLLGYSHQIGELQFNISVNGGYSKNKLLFSDEAEGAPDWQRATGQPLFSNLVYLYDGVFADQEDIDSETLDYAALTNNLRPGDMKFQDFDGDGAITPDDRVRTGKNHIPRFQGGVNLSARYRNFDLTILFQGASGGEIFLNFSESGTIGNYTASVYDNRWTVNNPSSEHPRISNRGDQYFSHGNTYWRSDTDYIRLKNFELGYTLPFSLSDRIGMNNLRFYVNGLNLFTITDALFDPEGDDPRGRDYPNARIINTGLSVTF